MASTTKMSALKSSPISTIFSRTSFPSRVILPQRRVVCKAKNESLKTAVVASVPILLTTAPAMARVAETMNSEGTGTPLGITDNALGWAILITFGIVWALYAASAKELGGGETDDSGLSL